MARRRLSLWAVGLLLAVGGFAFYAIEALRQTERHQVEQAETEIPSPQPLSMPVYEYTPALRADEPAVTRPTPTPRPKPTPRPRNGAVAGMVLDASRRPARLVPLSLVPMKGKLVLDATSGKDGRFAFSEVLPGTYELVLARPRCALGGRSPLFVSAGARVDDVTLRLLPEAPIAGRVRANITGQPLPDARVAATMMAEDRQLLPDVAPFHAGIEVFTDTNGRYRLPGLWPGAHYNLEVRAEGYIPAALGRVRAGRAAVDLIVTPGGAISGKVVMANDGLPAPGAAVWAEGEELVRFTTTTRADGTYRLSGLPRDSYRLDAQWEDCYAAAGPWPKRWNVQVGREVLDASLQLLRGSSLAVAVVDRRTGLALPFADVDLSGAFGKLAAECNEAGEAGFTALREGSYELAACADSYAATSTLVSIVGSRQERCVLTLVGGKVVAGRVLDPAGEPVVGAEVKYSRVRADASPSSAPTFQGNVKTDAAGCFRYDPLDYGSYDLAASAPNYALGRAFDVETGDERVEIGLSAGGAIAGQVTSATGAPLANIKVAAAGLPYLNDDLTLRGANVKTDESGRYRMEHLEPGNYVVSAELPKYKPTPALRPGAPPPTPTPLRRSDAGGISVAAAEPLPAPTPPKPKAPPKSGWPGIDAGKAVLPAGPSRITPPDIADLRTRQTVHVDESKTTTLNLGAKGTVLLSGTVMQGGLNAGPGLLVALTESPTWDMDEAKRWGVANTSTDEKGRFRLGGLEPRGEYHLLVARKVDRLPISQRVHMPGSGERHIVVPLPAGGIQGTVVNPKATKIVKKRVGKKTVRVTVPNPVVNGAQITVVPRLETDAPGLQISYSDVRLKWGRKVRSDRKGFFKIDEVPAGDYFLRVDYKEYTQLFPVSVGENGYSKVRIVLQVSGALRGNIRGMGLEERSRLYAVFYFHDAETDAVFPEFPADPIFNGQYRLAALDPGNYDVTCLVHSPFSVVAPIIKRSVVIRAGQATFENFDMEPGVSVRINVFDETGLPLPNATVAVHDAGDHRVRGGLAETRMLYNAWSAILERKPYRLRVRKEGYRETVVDLDLSRSESSLVRRVALVHESLPIDPRAVQTPTP